MHSTTEIRIAVLVNHPPHTAFRSEVKQAFVDVFSAVAPHARVEFFDPIVLGEYPDPKDYDLTILSGGKGNSLDSDPWILRQIDFVKYMVEKFPTKKLMGICFGHQLIARALGGKARNIPSGPIAGLLKVNLTKEGCEYFPRLADKASFKASQFHVRGVEIAAPNFIQLAENNEALLSRTNTIVSFQAHPEIDGVFSKKILDGDDLTYVDGLTLSEVDDLKMHCTDPQDGPEILRRVIEWVQEEAL